MARDAGEFLRAEAAAEIACELQHLGFHEPPQGVALPPPRVPE